MRNFHLKPYYVLSSQTKKFIKKSFNKKHRQIGKNNLEEIRKEYNYHKNFNEDKVIKDRRYLKIKAREVVPMGRFGFHIERRNSNARLLMLYHWA